MRKRYTNEETKIIHRLINFLIDYVFEHDPLVAKSYAASLKLNLYRDPNKLLPLVNIMSQLNRKPSINEMLGNIKIWEQHYSEDLKKQLEYEVKKLVSENNESNEAVNRIFEVLTGHNTLNKLAQLFRFHIDDDEKIEIAHEESKYVDCVFSIWPLEYTLSYNLKARVLFLDVSELLEDQCVFQQASYLPFKLTGLDEAQQKKVATALLQHLYEFITSFPERAKFFVNVAENYLEKIHALDASIFSNLMTELKNSEDDSDIVIKKSFDLMSDILIDRAKMTADDTALREIAVNPHCTAATFEMIMRNEKCNVDVLKAIVANKQSDYATQLKVIKHPALYETQLVKTDFFRAAKRAQLNAPVTIVLKCLLENYKLCKKPAKKNIAKLEKLIKLIEKNRLSKTKIIIAIDNLIKVGGDLGYGRINKALENLVDQINHYKSGKTIDFEKIVKCLQIKNGSVLRPELRR